MADNLLKITKQLDNEGYLIELDNWTPALASTIASTHGIILTKEHWLVINYLRNFFQDFPTLKIPAMRVVIKFLREQLGETKGNTIYFQQLFPKGLVQAYQIAGLPKTKRCSKNAF